MSAVKPPPYSPPYPADSECAKCKGTGLVADGKSFCLCRYVEDRELREVVRESLAKTVRNLRRELTEQGEEHPMVKGTAGLVGFLLQGRKTRE